MVNKYKEFYIYESYDGRTDSVSEYPLINVPWQIHVIEYAAVEEARVVAERAQCDLLAAKEALEIAREALEKLERGSLLNHIATDALTKIREKIG